MFKIEKVKYFIYVFNIIKKYLSIRQSIDFYLEKPQETFIFRPVTQLPGGHRPPLYTKLWPHHIGWEMGQQDPHSPMRTKGIIAHYFAAPLYVERRLFVTESLAMFLHRFKHLCRPPPSAKWIHSPIYDVNVWLGIVYSAQERSIVCSILYVHTHHNTL